MQQKLNVFRSELVAAGALLLGMQMKLKLADRIFRASPNTSPSFHSPFRSRADLLIIERRQRARARRRRRIVFLSQGKPRDPLQQAVLPLPQNTSWNFHSFQTLLKISKIISTVKTGYYYHCTAHFKHGRAGQHYLNIYHLLDL